MTELLDPAVCDSLKKGVSLLKMIFGGACQMLTISPQSLLDLEDIHQNIRLDKYSLVDQVKLDVIQAIDDMVTVPGVGTTSAAKVRSIALKLWAKSFKAVLIAKEKFHARVEEPGGQSLEPAAKRKKQIRFSNFKQDNGGAYHVAKKETEAQQLLQKEHWLKNCRPKLPQEDGPVLSRAQQQRIKVQMELEKKTKQEAEEDKTAAAAAAGLARRMKYVKESISNTWGDEQVTRESLAGILSQLQESEKQQALVLARDTQSYTDAMILQSFQTNPRVWNTLSEDCTADAVLVAAQESKAWRTLSRTRADILMVESRCSEIDCEQRNLPGNVRACIQPMVAKP